jgi:hypothetical protein
MQAYFLELQQDFFPVDLPHDFFSLGAQFFSAFLGASAGNASSLVVGGTTLTSSLVAFAFGAFCAGATVCAFVFKHKKPTNAANTTNFFMVLNDFKYYN